MILNRGTAFSPYTPAELQNLEKQEKAAKEALKKARKSAAKCLAQPDFREHWEAVKSAEAAIIEFLKRHDDPDPVRFAFKMKEYQVELRNISFLVDRIRTIAGNNHD